MSNCLDLENTGPSIPTSRLTCESVGLEVWIEVDGNEVPHYAREYNEDKKEMTCWIESEAGKPFSINHKSTTDEYAMGMQVLLDGRLLASYFLSPEIKNLHRRMTCVRTSHSEGQQLTFGLLELTDDDAYLDGPSQSETFGEIKLVIDKKSSFKESDNPNPTYHWAGTERVHERSKKGLTHQIKPGPTSQMPISQVFNTTSAGILATFVIRYRTRAMLQANGIIPPDPTRSISPDLFRSTSPSLSVKRELSEEQSDDDEGQTDEREMALLAELEEIRQKKRAKNPGSGSRKKIKVEAVAHKFHVKPGQVIDLTDDVPKVKARSMRKGNQVKKEIIDLTL